MILTLKQAALFLSLHPNTLYHLAQQRRIPSAKIGGQWRFNQLTLETWLDGKMRTTEAVGKR